MNTTARSPRPKRWELMRWELCWIPVEMAGVAVALLLAIGLDNREAGTLVIFGVVAFSWVVRFVHYSNLSSRGVAEPDRRGR